MTTAAQLGRTVEILLVEDSPTDAELAQEALKESRLLNRIHHVIDGVEALAFLRKEGEYSDVPHPDLVLLDLNLPRLSGNEVLKEIRADEQLTALIVVVLTTSRDERDILQAYGCHANAYISKPVDFDKFVDVVKSIENFWFTVVALPPRN